MANTHISKLSYIGDPLHFEFPSSDESLVLYKEEDGKTNHSVIERAGSIFIKSGIDKVTPFPVSQEESSAVQNNKNTTAAISECDQIEFDKKHDIIEDLKGDEYVEDQEEAEVRSETEDKPINQNETVNEFTDNNDQPGEKSRSNTEESHYESQQMFSPQTSLLQKRTSLRQANSISSFVNPYLRGSILRRHQKEVANDEILNKRVQSMRKGFSPDVADLAEEEEVEINKDDLQIPRRSSKRVPRLLDLNRQASMSRKISLMRKNRNLTRNESKRSINTLANDPKKYGHSFKSVDLSGLDQILVELLNVKEGSICNSRTNSTNSKVGHRNLPTDASGNYSNDANIKPFNASSSISRNKSLKRSISTAASDARLLSEKPELPKKSFNNNGTGLPKVNEEKPQKTCELKRSNALKRKPILIEFLVRVCKIFKEASKKCWRKIKSPAKKNVTFNKKKTAGSIKKNGKQSVKIGKPTLVDIKDTPFKSHVINMGDEPAKQNLSTAPSAPFGGNNISNMSVETAVPIKERLSTIASVGDDEKSKQISVENEIEKGEDEQLEDMWKQYLSATIRNRIDMKVDVSKLDYIERVKSIQSDSARRDAIDETGKLEVEKIMNKYITSEESSRSSTMSQSMSSCVESMVTAPMYDAASEIPSLSESSRERASTGSWTTIDSEDDNASATTTSSRSISTIEEEPGLDRVSTQRSSISTMEDVDDVYEEYSMLSDDGEDVETESCIAGDDHDVSISLRSGGGTAIVRQNASTTSLKQSGCIMNLQSILNKRNETMTKSQLGNAKSNLLPLGSRSSSVLSNSVYSDSEAFSFSRSVSSVCMV